MNSTSLDIQLDIARDFFEPEIVVDPADEFSPVVYLPYLPVALDETLPQQLVDAAWAAYDADNPMTAEVDDGGVGAEYIDISNDDGVECLRQTPPLKLARFGRQVVRIYAPSDVEPCTAYASTMFGWVCLSGGGTSSSQEKMIAYNSLDGSCREHDDSAYGLTPLRDTEDSAYYAGRAGRFDAEATAGKRRGRFNQLKNQNTAHGAQYFFRYKFGGQEYKRIYIISGNRGRHAADKQISRLGRRSTVYREVLQFSGDTEKTIRYWYDNPSVTVLAWTEFLLADGSFADVRPINVSPGDTWWDDNWAERTANRHGYKAKKGKTFYSKMPVWGSLLVEYTVHYTAFELFYDFPQPTRTYEIVPGGIERVGKLIFDYADSLIVNESALHNRSIGYDKQKKDKDWIRANKSKADFDHKNAPNVYLKLFPKIRFKPFRCPAIELFFTNGKRVATTRWHPPQPEFMDFAQDELPKMEIFQESKRYRRYADDAVSNDDEYGEYERVIESVFVDPLGNVTRQRYEEGDDASEDNRPERD